MMSTVWDPVVVAPRCNSETECRWQRSCRNLKGHFGHEGLGLVLQFLGLGLLTGGQQGGAEYIHNLIHIYIYI